jgi:hypothetical protein
MTTNPLFTENRIEDLFRTRVIVITCALVTIIAGVFAAAIAIESTSVILLVATFAVAALILPRAWIPIALVVLIPLQFYFPVAGRLNLRGIFVFAVVAALRFGVHRMARKNSWRWSAWMLPALLFVIAASISAIAAENRYAAFKGIYDWLPIFAAAFVVSEAVTSTRWFERLLVGLVIAGLAEALLGIAQSLQSVGQIVQRLQMPLSGIVYQPNLLRDRLIDLSFNWVLDGRVIPFGTFINAIDYAIFLAAILMLGLGLTIDAKRVAQKIFWAVASGAMLGALLMTFKGSGILALAGGLMIFAFVYARQLDVRVRMFGLGVMLVGGFVVLAFEPVAQRILFLLQREAGMLTGVGRAAIWMQLFAALPRQWLFGFGLNNAVGLVEPLPSLRGGEFVLVPTAPESAYVAALVETGIVGFILLVWFIVVVLRQAYRSASCTPRQLGVFAALVALFIGNLTVTGLTSDQNSFLFGILIGIVFASANDHTPIGNRESETSS